MPLNGPIRAGLVGVLALAWVTGCTAVSGEELYPPIDPVPPEVVACLPPDGWIQVPRMSVVQLWFSEPVDAVSVGPASISLTSGHALADVDYEVSEDELGQGLVELRPRLPLIGGVIYQLLVTTAVTDRVGNPLPQPVRISFRTAR
jgi:hypothetical protein